MKNEILPESKPENQPVISLVDIESLIGMDFAAERIQDLAIKRTNQLKNEPTISPR